MKKARKILSVVIALLFLVNNLSMADVLNTSTLAPESRLAPLQTPELLDVMKLTAEITATVSKAENKDLREVARDTVHEIDKITEGNIIRKGDVLTFRFRDKLIFSDGDIVVIPCSIKGVKLGNKRPSEREYYCCAKRTAEGKYDFEFFNQKDVDEEGRARSKTRSVGLYAALMEAMEGVANKTRGAEEKEAIDRFVEQQNNTDRIISEAIANGEEVRLDPDDVWVQYCTSFLAALGNTALYDQFKQLVDIGQVMLIPGLEKPHAGGIGIYLPADITFTQSIIIHETFAKCGFTDRECEDLEVIFYKLQQARRINADVTLADVQDLNEIELKLIEKAKQASFEGRWNDPINIDYYKKTEIKLPLPFATITNHELLDIMKLTAEITAAVSEPEKPDLAKVVLDIIHEIGTVPAGIRTRKLTVWGGEEPDEELVREILSGEMETDISYDKIRNIDVLSFLLSDKEVLAEGSTIFLPCSIEGKRPGDEESSRRFYLCRAQRTPRGKYEFEFFTAKDLFGDSKAKSMDEKFFLAEWRNATEGLLTPYRPEEVRQAIARFVEQQNDTDKVIREAIETGKAKRVFAHAVPATLDGFLNKNVVIPKYFISMCLKNPELAGEYWELVEMGQVMEIPGLVWPHAGGIGIYLPTGAVGVGEIEGDKDAAFRWNDTHVVHEIFAKCGFTSDECRHMVEIYEKWTEQEDVKSLPPYDKTPEVKYEFNDEDKQLIEKARKASFKNRWEDPINVDYYRAEESPFAPLRVPELLDIMKLTAELEGHVSELGDGLLTYVEGDIKYEIDTIEKGEVARKGDVLEYLFSKKSIIDDGALVFMPCYIEGVQLGSEKSSKRFYVCCARKIYRGKYQFTFFTPRDLFGDSAAESMDEEFFLSEWRKAVDGLGDEVRSRGVNKAIARFVEQQNESDKIIRKAIAEGKEERLDHDQIWVRYCRKFLTTLGNTTLYQQFYQLVDTGQVMQIPGLKKSHGGGIGIYLNPETTHIATILIHETFAKCGLTDDECNRLERIFDDLWHAEIKLKKQNATLDDLRSKVPIAGVRRLSEEDERVIAKAQKASFKDRWNDPINIDYYKLVDAVAVEKELAEMMLIERMRGSGKKWYLGIDSSTQSVTFTIIDVETGEVIYKHKEEFDDAYYVDKYGAEKGVLPHPHAPELYHTDPIMLADALDRGMEKISKDFRNREWDIFNIQAISGAGQQHGTVCYNKFAEKSLKQLDPNRPLAEQLIDTRILARETAAIWQDGTTEDETREMEDLARELYGEDDEAIGPYGEAITKKEVPAEGAGVLRRLTGSAGTLRFGLAQIMAFFKRHKRAYDAADTILNIAAYNGSLLAGMARFPWDVGDAAGSNAMNIKTRKWMKRFIDKLAPGLSAKLPDILPSNSVVGPISHYWIERYGFSPKTQIVNWTGDNPSAMAGQGIIKKGQIAVSLGTSYTMYTFLNKKDLDRTLLSKYGHVFGEPTGRYMKLICFQNGALTLEQIRDKHISDSEAISRLKEMGNNDPTEEEIEAMKWHIFTEEIEKTKAGNDGAMMIAQHKTEDTPRIPLPDRPYTRNLDESSRAQVFRAAVEGQFYLMKWIADQVGLEVSDIKLTGGVSVNPAIRQILADIFDATVNVLKDSDSVSLGSAIRAAKADHDADADKPDLKWKDAIKGLTDIDKDKTVNPNAENVAVYQENFGDFVSLLETALSESETAPPSTHYISDQGITNYIRNVLDVPAEESMEMIEDMHSEMDKGLAGEKSSLQMIPTHSEPAVGDERGVVVTLDFGGSNFRVYLEEVRNGEIIQKEDELYQLRKEHMEAESPEVLFDFLAQCINDFVDKYEMDKEKEIPISFIFSFPADQKSIKCGIFKFWTKGFKVKGMKDKDVVKLLNDALARAGLLTMNVEALANDTVAAFQAGRYRHKDCDAGIIIATGTNGAIVLKLKDIPKYKGPGTASGEMVVNMEWGNYKVRRRTPYDLQVDDASADPGKYTFEKAISGKYLNEQAKAIFRDLIWHNIIFSGQMHEAFREGAVEEEGKRFETKMMDDIIADTSDDLSSVAEVLTNLGIDSTWNDRRRVQEICDLLITRSARLCATGIAAIVTYRDPNLERTHTASIDGSLYQKCPGYADKLRAALEEMFGKKASNIKIFTEKNMTGKGAAVISLVAKRVPDATTMDASAGEVVEQMRQANPVIFVPQHFITKQRCGQLAKEFPGAEFITFDQNANIDKLPDLLARYPEQKKVIVGMGLDFDQVKGMIEERPDDFKGVVPLNFSDEGVSGLRRNEKKSLQRSVISIALLAGTLPEEGYEETHSYRTLRTLLDIVLPEEADIDTYVNNLLSADMDTGKRFSYLINTMLRPIVPYDHKQLEYIVNFLVAA